LRRLLRGRLVGEGLSWLLVSLVAFIFVTMGLDYWLRLPERPLRAIFMLAGLGPILFIIWRQIVVPLRVPMTVDDLALLVERRYPQLGDRLISAVQFQRGRGPAGSESLSLVRRMAAEANALAADVSFRAVVERVELRRVLVIAACAGALLSGFAVWQGDAFGRWFQRNVLLADVDWPQRTYLTVRDESFAILGDSVNVVRGDDLTVNILVEPGSDSPPYVMVHARYGSVGDTEAKIDPNPEDARRFVKTFRSVTEAFTFYVVGGDDRRDKRRKHRVRLVAPPAVKSLWFHVQPPAYTKRRASRQSGSTAVLSVPVGAAVRVEAEATKDLRAAQLVLTRGNKVDKSPMHIGRIQYPGWDRPVPRQLVGRFDVSGRNQADVGTLQLVLEDTRGYANRRGQTYLIEMIPDQPPTVGVKKRGVGPAVTAEAMIPLVITAKDDYGILRARVRATVTNRKQKLSPDTVALAGRRPRPATHTLDLRGRALRPGDRVAVQVVAEDSLPSDMGGPNVGRSAGVDLQIVRPEELRSQLVARQKALRLEFLQAIGLQNDAQAKTASAAMLLSQAEAGPEVARRAAVSANLQASVASECARTGQAFAAILEEMVLNRLVRPGDRKRIQDEITTPLKSLVARAQATAAALGKAKSAAQDEVLAGRLAELATEQDEIRQAMEKIAEAMEKEATRQELANELGVIIDESKRLLELIREKEAREAGKIFDPTTRPGSPEKK